MNDIKFRQWTVTRDGLESHGDRVGYCYQIDKSRLAEVREGGLSDWFAHLADKVWFDPDDFAVAWLAACMVHKINISKIDIGLSVAYARWQVERYKQHEAKRAELFPEPHPSPFRGIDAATLMEQCDAADAALAPWYAKNPRPTGKVDY